MRIRNTIHPEACPFLGKRSCQVLRTGILVQYQLRCQIVDSWNAYKLDNCWPPGPNIIITSFSPESKLNLAWNINNGCLACGHRHLIHFSPFRILIPISHRDKGGSRAQVSSTDIWYPQISIYTFISGLPCYFLDIKCASGASSIHSRFEGTSIRSSSSWADQASRIYQWGR